MIRTVDFHRGDERAEEQVSLLQGKLVEGGADGSGSCDENCGTVGLDDEMAP